MSLRCRLIALVAAVLSVSFAAGGVLALFIARQSVRTEMGSAMLVAHQTVDQFAKDIDRSPEPQRELDDLIGSFRGSRHLQVSITGNAAVAEMVWPAGERSTFGKVPGWFVRLIGVAPETDRVPITSGGDAFAVVVITTNPRNEVFEVWNEMSGVLVVVLFFGGLTLPLMYVCIGGALRPLDRLSAAMAQVGEGDYGVRISDRLTPELARLRDSFNLMTIRLAAADADNRRLNEQLLTLQEEERSDITRDLHDEVGPFLFAINVDVTNLSRLLQERRIEELPALIQSITEAMRHLQRQVRNMLGRLRPIGLSELGLGDALRGLVDFWRGRYPEIDYRVAVSANCQFDDATDRTIYRIVQESLSNAVRHGKPRLISISIEHARANDEVIVEVADDGSGVSGTASIGYGLIGMEERVKSMGGRLTLANRTGGGFTVSATLPSRDPSQLASPLSGIA